MLSTAAANALLKTLEEPPSHVVFVLATTDPQKVPPTIRSRTQHLEFRLLGAETLHDLLESVNEVAGLHVDGEALEAAVRRGRGSARDALSALDQVVASGSSDAARPELAAVLEALADGDVNPVLVALSALLAGGWGPQQLATELIDDLRQVFLAALAPELCTVSGPSLERFRALAEAMGLARVVRSMEILGHALVDMREAPDAQVVLEIAAVRAVRPDLDSGSEALSERVSVLERTLSGAAAFPRPEAPAPRDPPSGSDATGRTSTATVAPETPAAPGPPAEVGRRPSIGAVRRSREATDSTPTSRATDPEPASAASEPAPTTEPHLRRSPRRGRRTAVAEPGRDLDRDSLTEAWGDGILQSLPARAKARYASGRFVSVDEQGVHFALPNSAHRDQCAEQQSVVEEALTAHFGTKITLVLDIDEAAAPPVQRSGTSSATPGRSSGAAPPDSDPPADEGEDVDARRQLMDGGSTDQASDAEARLLQAFPGASEVAH